LGLFSRTSVLFADKWFYHFKVNHVVNEKPSHGVPLPASVSSTHCSRMVIRRVRPWLTPDTHKVGFLVKFHFTAIFHTVLWVPERQLYSVMPSFPLNLFRYKVLLMGIAYLLWEGVCQNNNHYFMSDLVNYPLFLVLKFHHHS
jgi:hypothetical protein